MKDEIVKQLDGVLPKVLKFVERSAEFVGDQAPLLVSEILNYNLVRGGAISLFGLTFLVIGLLAYKEMRREYAKSDPIGDKVVMLSIVSVGGIILGTIVFCSNILNVAKVLLAPRLYVIDYLRGIL